MSLNEWAIKWGVSFEAVEDLRREFGTVSTEPEPQRRGGDAEAEIQAEVRLEASLAGARLFRNNVGACVDDRGNFIRYGLANDSKKMNERVKSSDLIGIRLVLITPQHVGQTIGQFVAREVKAADWRYSATDRERAQLHFLEIVASLGGDACFANGPGTI